MRCTTEDQTRAEFVRLWGERRSVWLAPDRDGRIHGLGEPLSPARLRAWEKRGWVARGEYVKGKGVLYVRGDVE